MDFKHRRISMKKFTMILIFVMVGAFCFAQSNNDAQKIIGTWKAGGVTCTFNSNGTYAIQGVQEDLGGGNYFINGGRLILQSGNNAVIRNFYFSSDGKVLIFPVILVKDSRPGTLWFVKQ